MRCLLPMALAVTTSLLAGCSTVALNGSRLESLPAGVRTRAHGTGAELDIEGVRVLLLTGDTTAAGQPPASLRIRIVVRASDAGASFDPDGLRLRTADGSEWPVRAWKAGRLESGTCRLPKPAPGQTPVSHGPGQRADADAAVADAVATNGRVPLVPGTCVDLGFARALRPNQRAELRLDGFARHGRPLPPLSVTVRRGHWRGVERAYWLEALAVAGYVLAPY